MHDLPRRYRFERDIRFDGLLEAPLMATCVGAPAGDEPRTFRLELRVAPAAWRRIWREGLFHLSPLSVPDGSALPPVTDPTSKDDAPVRLVVSLHPVLVSCLDAGEEGDRAVLEGLLGPDPSPFKNAFAWQAWKVLWRDRGVDEAAASTPADGGVYVGWATAWADAN